jgi:SAM-dependent methyltransferase
VDRDLSDSMRRYYDERAAEYDDAYVHGTGTASIPTPHVFQHEAITLANVVEGLVGGSVVDLACGTAYWLPCYAQRCSRACERDKPWRVPMRQRFAELLGTLPPGASVLELGSGPGYLAECVLDRCRSVETYTLLDFSEGMLGISRESERWFSRLVGGILSVTMPAVPPGGPPQRPDSSLRHQSGFENHRDRRHLITLRRDAQGHVRTGASPQGSPHRSIYRCPLLRTARVSRRQAPARRNCSRWQSQRSAWTALRDEGTLCE